jgi:5-methylcytosine-specific restriction enzyme A
MADKAKQYKPSKTTAQSYKPPGSARPSSAKRGYDRRWTAIRNVHLADHPLCVKCEARGLVVEATVVDHITPHCGNEELLHDTNNLQSLCKSCHGRKSATSDGAFGNERKPPSSS